MSTIYLIRHGNTAANEAHLYCGSTDLPLSESGIAQLAALRTRYEAVRADVFVTSGMRRTDETLAVLFGTRPHQQDSRLREMDFGIFEMHSYEELKDDAAYQAWITGDNDANITPGGESGAQMTARVVQAFEDILQSGQDTVVITHGGVIAAIMAYLFPQENKNRYQWQPKPGCGYAVTDFGYQPLPIA